MRRLWKPFQNRWIKWAITLFTFGGTAGILGYLLYSQRDLLLSYAWVVRWQPVIISFIVYSLALLIVVAAWVSIVNSFGAHVSLKRHFRYFCISNLSRRLPGTVWYIAYRAHFYGQEGLSVRSTSMATAVEFAVSIISASLISMIFAVSFLLKNPLGILLVITLLVVCLIFLQPKVIGWLLRRMGQAESWYDLRSILKWTGLYMLFWLVGGTLFFLTANIIYPLDIQYLGIVIGAFAIVGLVGRAITFLPSNMGLQEISYSLILSTIMPASVAIVLALANRIVVIGFEILWTLLSLVIESTEIPAINPK
jgi:glycosyltransferase 2 family protein